MELYDTVRSGELDSLMCARDFPENFTRPSCNLTHEEVMMPCSYKHTCITLYEPTESCSYILNDGSSFPEGSYNDQLKEGNW